MDLLQLDDVAVRVVEIARGHATKREMLRRRNEVDAGGLQARMLGVNIDHVERDVADADVAGRPSLAGLRLRLRIAEHFHLHVAELELCDLPARLAHANRKSTRLNSSH